MELNLELCQLAQRKILCVCATFRNCMPKFTYAIDALAQTDAECDLTLSAFSALLNLKYFGQESCSWVKRWVRGHSDYLGVRTWKSMALFGQPARCSSTS